jgi:hypothetical protein
LFHIIRKKNLDEGIRVSYNNYGTVYPVIGFDVTKENDEALFGKTRVAEVEVNWTWRAYQNMGCYLNCVVESRNDSVVLFLLNKLGDTGFYYHVIK